MKLIINKELDNINDSVNIKIIEITSADFLNNDLDYFVYKYQIPLIKFIDTEEIFNIKNFKSNLNSSLAETLIIIDETDLELISGGGGGSQDLQSVLNINPTATLDSNSTISLGGATPFNREITLDINDEENTIGSTLGMGNSFLNLEQRGLLGVQSKIYQESGIISIEQFSSDINRIGLTFETPIADSTIKIPAKPAGDYILATTDDIPTSPISGTFAVPTSITVTNGIITAIS